MDMVTMISTMFRTIVGRIDNVHFGGVMVNFCLFTYILWRFTFRCGQHSKADDGEVGRLFLVMDGLGMDCFLFHFFFYIILLLVLSFRVYRSIFFH